MQIILDLPLETRGEDSKFKLFCDSEAASLSSVIEAH
jgi:hypothetical protein